MTPIIMFVYALIIFLFLFIIETNGGIVFYFSQHFQFFKFILYIIFYNFYFYLFYNAEKLPCFTVKDCPMKLYYLSKCVRYVCEYLWNRLLSFKISFLNYKVYFYLYVNNVCTFIIYFKNWFVFLSFQFIMICSKVYYNNMHAFLHSFFL